MPRHVLAADDEISVNTALVEGRNGMKLPAETTA
jgi:hypothetical protein